jgi:hypothetical protein
LTLLSSPASLDLVRTLDLCIPHVMKSRHSIPKLSRSRRGRANPKLTRQHYFSRQRRMFWFFGRFTAFFRQPHDHIDETARYHEYRRRASRRHSTDDQMRRARYIMHGTHIGWLLLLHVNQSGDRLFRVSEPISGSRTPFKHKTT